MREDPSQNVISEIFAVLAPDDADLFTEILAEKLRGGAEIAVTRDDTGKIDRVLARQVGTEEWRSFPLKEKQP